MADGPKLDIYANRNNSAADCSISQQFVTEFDSITADTLYKRSTSTGQKSRSQRNVWYQQ